MSKYMLTKILNFLALSSYVYWIWLNKIFSNEKTIINSFFFQFYRTCHILAEYTLLITWNTNMTGTIQSQWALWEFLISIIGLIFITSILVYVIMQNDSKYWRKMCHLFQDFSMQNIMEQSNVCGKRLHRFSRKCTEKRFDLNDSHSVKKRSTKFVKKVITRSLRCMY